MKTTHEVQNTRVRDQLHAGSVYAQKYYADAAKSNVSNSIKTLEALLPAISGSRSEEYIKSAQNLLTQAHEDILMASRLIK